MGVRARVGLSAADVKAALRRRHPAIDPLIVGPGQWTTVEEFLQIDLLAFNAWGGKGAPRYGRVGYEVKVSRSDYRRELLTPSKRAKAVGFCHEFYFAVPRGLLKPDELAFAPPVDLAFEAAYERQPCPGYFGAPCRSTWIQGSYDRTRRRRRAQRRGPHVVSFGHGWERRYDVVCPTCAGKGYLVPSLAERICPTLWIPADVGLIEVDGTGCHVTKPAPRRKPQDVLTDQFVSQLVRHVSWRPDPRHVARRPRSWGDPVESCPDCGCPGERYDGHVCEDYAPALQEVAAE